MIYVLPGGTKLFAAIGVKYPAGSTLSCTNGTKTLTAKTTSGQWVFAIPKAGTWTVTATDGDKSKSADVEIIAEGQVESVVLSYELVLFDNGFVAPELGTFLCVDSGGYTRLTDEYIGLGSNPNAVGKFVFDGPLNIKTLGYKTLHIKFRTSISSGTIGLSKTKIASSISFVASTTFASGLSDEIVSVSVENVGDSVYFAAVANTQGDQNNGSRISKVWLE